MRIWVDFENTPHVLILKPIIDELERQEHQIIITARDCSQTIELAELFQLKVRRISHHHGKNKVNKLLGHLSRIARLIHFIHDKEVSVAISHGSRSQIVAAGLLKIPTFVMWDYEHASLAIVHHFINKLVVPEILSLADFDSKIDHSKIINYPGIKEHIYAATLLSYNSSVNDLALDQSKIIITMRPPATDAHYHNHHDGSNEIFYEGLKYFSNLNNTIIIVLARTKLQQREILKFVQKYCPQQNIIFPVCVQNGLILIWNSDIVIGGGGTMNREAAVLGIPVYSIFQGKLGVVDRYLSESGRLRLIHTKDQLREILVVKRRCPEKPPLKENKELVKYLIEKILEMGQKVNEN